MYTVVSILSDCISFLIYRMNQKHERMNREGITHDLFEVMLPTVSYVCTTHFYAPQRWKHKVAALSVYSSVNLSISPPLYLVRRLTLKLLLAFKSHLVYRQMAMRERAEPIILPCIFIELSPLNHIVHKCCLVGPYLGKYKRD